MSLQIDPLGTRSGPRSEGLHEGCQQHIIDLRAVDLESPVEQFAGGLALRRRGNRVRVAHVVISAFVVTRQPGRSRIRRSSSGARWCARFRGRCRSSRRMDQALNDEVFSGSRTISPT